MRVSVLYVTTLICFIGWGSAKAQEMTNLGTKCDAILNGEQGALLRNEVKRQKKVLFSSELIKKYCPSLSSLQSDEEKTNLMLKIFTAYSYAQVGCRTDAVMKGGWYDTFGGFYGLPLRYETRKTDLKGTPCDVPELTPSSQAACIVYLAGVSEGAPGLQDYGMIDLMKQKPQLQSAFVEALGRSAPECQTESSKDAVWTPHFIFGGGEKSKSTPQKKSQGTN